MITSPLRALVDVPRSAPAGLVRLRFTEPERWEFFPRPPWGRRMRRTGDQERHLGLERSREYAAQWVYGDLRNVRGPSPSS
jgi:hypothetical protein